MLNWYLQRLILSDIFTFFLCRPRLNYCKIDYHWFEILKRNSTIDKLHFLQERCSVCLFIVSFNVVLRRSKKIRVDIFLSHHLRFYQKLSNGLHFGTWFLSCEISERYVKDFMTTFFYCSNLAVQLGYTKYSRDRMLESARAQIFVFLTSGLYYIRISGSMKILRINFLISG